MPKNKLASFRYRVINNCLRNTARRWTRQNLMDEIAEQLYEQFGVDRGISKRTFHYDIELMRSMPPRGFDAPIVEQDGYYRYEDSSYSIERSELSETDIEAINNALTLLNNFPKLSIQEELAMVQAKFQGALALQGEEPKPIWFEQKDVIGAEYIEPLYKAICNKQPIDLCYKPFKAPTSNVFVVHPYLLKQYNHRWYLIGYCPSYERTGIYSLDRIVRLQKADDIFIPNTFFDPASYFKDIIGVTLPEGESVQRIHIRVSSSQAPYILTKPLHHTQQVLEVVENGVEIALDLIPNYEFYSLLFGYGASLEVLSPQSVRQQVQNKLFELHQRYKKEQKED